jgi:hypothetical protein
MIPITGYDQVQVEGSVTLLPTSVLRIEQLGAQPSLGDSFQIIANSVGGPIQVNGAFGSIISAFGPCAFLFDATTGRLLATGLNGSNQSFGNLGSNPNEQNAAQAIFDAALAGSSQLDSDTFAGMLAMQILGNPSNLAAYTPVYYGAMSDYAFMGDRAIMNLIWNRVSVFTNLCNTPCSGFSVYGSYLQSGDKNLDRVYMYRQDGYGGLDYTFDCDFLLGATISRCWGRISSDLGKGEAEGLTGVFYIRKNIFSHFTLYVSSCCSTQENTLHRSTFNGKVKGSCNTFASTSNIALEYLVQKIVNFSIVPRINVVYSYARVHGFSEHGAVDELGNKGYTANLLTSEIGLSAMYCTTLFDRSLSFEAIGSVEHAFMNDKSNMDLKFKLDQMIAYSIDFSQKKQTRGKYGLNMGYNLWKSATVYAGYEGLTGNIKNRIINAGLRISF